ncbi:MAG TPA: acyl-CoA dehydrogenase family protein [Actinomycetota bacterium]|nr:acyl-CoA dehydrogenase family protein [Actinomycetota bacterium]
MDFRIADEDRRLIDAFRSFVDREVRPVEQRFQPRLHDDVFDEEMREAGLALRRRSADLGYYAAHMPEEVGGGGLGNLSYTLLVEEAATTGLRFASFVLGPPNPEAPTPILMDLPPHLRDKYVPPLVRAERTMCFALTEPEAGSDAQAIATTAVLDGDAWVLNGRKHFITNGAHADYAVVFAVTEREKRAGGGITAFFVERGSPGFVVGKHQRTLAGDTNQAELVFEDCRVPRDHVIGEVGYGFGTAMKFLNAGRAYIGAMCVGIADHLVRISVEQAKARHAFGKPIGKYQGIQWMLADSALEVHAARLMTYQLAWSVDRGEQPIRESSMVKLNNTEMVGRVADRAVQIWGGMGLLTEGPVERIYRWVRMLRIVEGTSEIQRLIIARTLGL